MTAPVSAIWNCPRSNSHSQSPGIRLVDAVDEQHHRFVGHKRLSQLPQVQIGGQILGTGTAGDGRTQQLTVVQPPYPVILV